jgi:hypothetical protein
MATITEKNDKKYNDKLVLRENIDEIEKKIEGNKVKLTIISLNGEDYKKQEILKMRIKLLELKSQLLKSTSDTYTDKLTVFLSKTSFVSTIKRKIIKQTEKIFLELELNKDDYSSEEFQKEVNLLCKDIDKDISSIKFVSIVNGSLSVAVLFTIIMFFLFNGLKPIISFLGISGGAI